MEIAKNLHVPTLICMLLLLGISPSHSIDSEILDKNVNGWVDLMELIQEFGGESVSIYLKQFLFIKSDSDDDGLLDRDEIVYGTNPNKIDTDADGWNDFFELKNGFDPKKVQGMIILPERGRAGQSFLIGISTNNSGQEKETQKVELKVNDKVVETREVMLEPGEHATASFSYKPKDPGTYKISVDGQETVLTVNEAKTNYALIAIILMPLVAIGAGVYLYRMGKLERLRKHLQGR